MKTIFVGGIPDDTKDDELEAHFSQFGKVRAMKLIRDVFTGKCKGFALIDMEGHEARAAIAGLDGKDFKGRPLRVNEEKPKLKGRGRGGRR